MPTAICGHSNTLNQNLILLFVVALSDVLLFLHKNSHYHHDKLHPLLSTSFLFLLPDLVLLMVEDNCCRDDWPGITKKPEDNCDRSVCALIVETATLGMCTALTARHFA